MLWRKKLNMSVLIAAPIVWSRVNLMMVLDTSSLVSTSLPSRASRSSSFSLEPEADLMASEDGTVLEAGNDDSRKSCPAEM